MRNSDSSSSSPPPPPPIEDNPPPPAPSFSDINGLTSAQRLPAITATQNTLSVSGVTQSSRVSGGVTQDSVSAVTDSAGNLMFHVVAGERESIMVDNSNPDADWTANPPPLLSTSYIFDRSSFASKTLANYNDGDFYAVTGFWYRDSDDFGVFVDGSPRTEPLPTSGRATYRGNVGGQYWGDLAGAGNTGAPTISGNFMGNIIINASIAADGTDRLAILGSINIPADSAIPNIQLDIEPAPDNNGDGVFMDSINNGITCSRGCSDIFLNNPKFSARLVGNPVTDAADDASSGEWPAGIIGAFGFGELELSNGVEIDAIGFFGAIHEDLCAATGTAGSAVFCAK